MDLNQLIQNFRKTSKLFTTIPTLTITWTSKIATKTVNYKIISEGVPENLKKKLHQIEANGGKPKIEL